MAPTLSRSSLVGVRLGAGTLELMDILGEGAYGCVYLARNLLTQEYVAIKHLPMVGTPRQNYLHTREVRIHGCLNHPNILPLQKVIQTSLGLFLVLEYAPEGDLFTAIAERGRFIGDEKAVRRVFEQLINAVAYCHSRGIYHRDLKTENIMVFEDDVIKLGDFGLATDEEWSMEFGCGSQFYYSPECLGGFDTSTCKPYATAPNDIWSLGVILINLICGRNPWRVASAKDPAFCAFLAAPAQFLSSRLLLSSHVVNLLLRIFTLDPQKRIQIDELRKAFRECPKLTRSPISYEISPISSCNAPSFADDTCLSESPSSSSFDSYPSTRAAETLSYSSWAVIEGQKGDIPKSSKGVDSELILV
ncbi:uncharacterized protein VTP21DRAFT_4100 [Calcarisporiella thermophila]|uniref:uncharacterized protein n=1 Tax=Calcarisporiella thermophila TaxID=911321 RepID=UPI003744ACDB